MIRYSPATAREIITDAPFEAMNREILEKPAFLFGDALEHSDEILFEKESKWLYQAGDLLMFLPDIERSYPLVYLQKLSSHRELEFGLTREYDSVATGQFGSNGAFQDGLPRCITGLLSGRVTKEHPVGEVPIRAKTFLSEFLAKGEQYPAKDFRMPGWVYSSGNMWWFRLVKHILDTHKQTLKEIGLYKAIRNVQFGLFQNSYHLFSLLEMYNSKTDSFFTPVGELGFALHEMFEVSGLSMGEVPYEEYIPTVEELKMLEAGDEHIYQTYWEMMCHYHRSGLTTSLLI